MDERAALITGGGSGIGAATARLLAAEGMTVAVVGRRRAPLEAVASAVDKAGGKGIAIVADIGEREAPARVVADVVARAGRLDVIVNNAAEFGVKRFEQFSIDEFDKHIAVNLRAAFFLVQEALPHLRRSPAAAVVNVSSAAAVMYPGQPPVYSLTKAALEYLTMNLAAALAPDGIRVNAVRPGPVATDIHLSADDPQARVARLGKLVPLGRVGEPEEVARWIAHLVEADERWTTGAVVPVDGGRVLGPLSSSP